MTMRKIDIKNSDAQNFYFGAAYLGVLRDKILRFYPGYEKLSLTKQYVVAVMAYNAGFGVLDNRHADFSVDPEKGYINFLDVSDGKATREWSCSNPHKKQTCEDTSGYHESFRHATSIARCMEAGNFDGMWATKNRDCNPVNSPVSSKVDSSAVSTRFSKNKTDLKTSDRSLTFPRKKAKKISK